MIDITTKLRSQAIKALLYPSDNILEDAALEIERLRRERDFYKDRTRCSIGFTYEPTQERVTVYAAEKRSLDVLLGEPGVAEMLRAAQTAAADAPVWSTRFPPVQGVDHD